MSDTTQGKMFIVPYIVSAYWDENNPNENGLNNVNIEDEITVEAVDTSEAYDKVSDLWDHDEAHIVNFSDIMGAYLTELDIDFDNIEEVV